MAVSVALVGTESCIEVSLGIQIQKGTKQRGATRLPEWGLSLDPWWTAGHAQGICMAQRHEKRRGRKGKERRKAEWERGGRNGRNVRADQRGRGRRNSGRGEREIETEKQTETETERGRKR